MYVSRNVSKEYTLHGKLANVNSFSFLAHESNSDSVVMTLLAHDTRIVERHVAEENAPTIMRPLNLIMH